LSAVHKPSAFFKRFHVASFLKSSNIRKTKDGRQGYQEPGAAGANGKFADFAICDVDGDGKDELLISQSYGMTADMRSYIYDYDSGSDRFTLEADASVFGLLNFYRTGYMACGENHAQGIGLGTIIWPYELYQYEKDTDSYRLICGFDAWDKNDYNEEYYGPFPDEKDHDGNGILYVRYQVESEEEGTVDYSDPEYLDDAEYQESISDKTDPADEITLAPYVLNQENLDRLDEIIKNRK